eukprot:1728854-Amphidinium_carterae.1
MHPLRRQGWERHVTLCDAWPPASFFRALAVTSEPASLSVNLTSAHFQNLCDDLRRMAARQHPADAEFSETDLLAASIDALSSVQ